MLDIKLIREKPELVKERLAARGAGDELRVGEVIRLDEQRRKLLAEVEALKAQRNKVSKEIGALMAQKKAEEAPSEGLKGLWLELAERYFELADQVAEDAALHFPNKLHGPFRRKTQF